MDKIVRDGKVAVLISRGYGGGWYSWHRIEELLFDPNIVMMLENPDDDEDLTSIVNYCHEKYGEDEYFSGVDGLTIVWVEQGRRFFVEEYDGAEMIRYEDEHIWLTA